MAKSEHLTERLVRKLEPRDGPFELGDETAVGFAVRVYPSGSKAFWFSYRISGRRRRITIGSWPAWSVVAARQNALELRRRVEAGEDPASDRDATRAAPRVADLITRYSEEHLPRLAPRNASDQRSMLQTLVAPPWGDRLVSEISAADVERLLAKIAEGRARPAKKVAKTRRGRELAPAKPTPIRANRTGEVLRKMFGLAVKWGMRADNPASGFYRRVERERDRFLSPDEIARLAAALDAAEDQRAAAIVRMCMLTGARLATEELQRVGEAGLFEGEDLTQEEKRQSEALSGTAAIESMSCVVRAEVKRKLTGR